MGEDFAAISGASMVSVREVLRDGTWKVKQKQGTSEKEKVEK